MKEPTPGTITHLRLEFGLDRRRTVRTHRPVNRCSFCGTPIGARDSGEFNLCLKDKCRESIEEVGAA